MRRSAIGTKRSGPNDQVVSAHAVLLGDRINTSSIEGETLSTSPLAIRLDKGGIAVLFRYGVVVLIGLSPSRKRNFWNDCPPAYQETPCWYNTGRPVGSPSPKKRMHCETVPVWKGAARLEDECELQGRVDTLNRKIAVIAEKPCGNRRENLR